MCCACLCSCSSSWYLQTAVHLSASVLSSLYLACIVHLLHLFSPHCILHVLCISFDLLPPHFILHVCASLASVHASLHHLSLPVPSHFILYALCIFPHSVCAIHCAILWSCCCGSPACADQPFWPHSFCAECSALQFSADALDALWPDGRSLEVAQR